MEAKTTLLVGRARQGKTRALLARYGQILAGQSPTAENGKALWIGPNQPAVSAVRDALVAAGNHACLQPSIVTFASFAEATLLRAPGLVRPVDSLQKLHLLGRVIQEAAEKKKLDYFAPVADRPGFRTLVAELISELKRRDIWAERFQQRCQNKRDRELSLLYSAYQRHLSIGNLYDSEGRFWAARSALQSDTLPTAVELPLVIVDGFKDFTAAQHEILRLLAGRSREMIISLAVDPALLGQETSPRALLFSAPARTLRRLQQDFPGAKVEAVAPKSPSTEAQAAAVPSLVYLEQNLFGDRRESGAVPKGVAASVGHFEILRANGVQGEIEAIARRVKTLLIAGTAKPGEVVVAFRSLDDVATRLGDVFEEFGIPHAIEARERLVTAPVVRLVTTLLELVAQDWPYRQLLQTVGNAHLSLFDQNNRQPSPERSNHSTDPRAALERFIRAAQLPAGRKPLLDQLQRSADREAQDREAQINEQDPSPSNRSGAQATVALNMLSRFSDHLSQLPQTASLQNWLAAIAALLKQLGVPIDGKIGASGEAFVAQWKQLAAGLHSVGLVDDWTGDAQRKWNLSELLRLIALVAGELRLPQQGDAVGRVRVLSVESARMVSAKHFFLAGLSEKAFPRPAGPDRLFDQRDYQRLSTEEPVEPNSSARGSSIDAVESNYSDEMLLFYDLVTRATERLTLSYAALNEKGQSQPPSPFVTQLEQCFGDVRLPEQTMPLAGPAAYDTAPLSRTELRQTALRRAREGDQQLLAQVVARESQLQKEAAQPAHSMLSALQALDSRSDRETFGPFEGLLTSDTALASLGKRFGGDHLWSPSQLETYADCPFRFFAEQVLSVEPLPDLALESDARRRGTLLHQTLATLHGQLLDARAASEQMDLDEKEAGILGRFQAALDETIDRLPLGGLQGVLREIERREIEKWGPAYADQDADYRALWTGLDQPPRPSFFEVRFGPGSRDADTLADESLSTPQPFQLNLGTEQIQITGQIDRIDLGKLGDVTVFTIIDYKSGKKKVKLNEADILSGRQLQLPLYAMAAEQMLLADRDAVPLAAGYWGVQETGFSAKKNSPALPLHEVGDGTLHVSKQWNNLRPKMLETVRQIVTGVRQGYFPVHNTNADCTKWCPLRTVCRIGHVRSLEKVWIAPEEEGTVGTEGGKA